MSDHEIDEDVTQVDAENVGLTRQETLVDRYLPQSRWITVNSRRTFALCMAMGLFISWLLFGQRSNSSMSDSPSETEKHIFASTSAPSSEPQIWTSSPTIEPTSEPTFQPTLQPTFQPTEKVTVKPTLQPTEAATRNPSMAVTGKPTVRVTPTISTSAPQTFAPLSSLPESYEVKDKIASLWQKFEEERYNLFKQKKEGTDEAKKIGTVDYKAFCDDWMKKHPEAFKVRYPFPPKADYYAKDPFSLKTLKEHLIRFKYAIADHYHYTSIEALDAFENVSETSLNRVAKLFFNKLQAIKKDPRNKFKIVHGFAGTSVMSGHDNCYANTLAPLLGRTLEHLFAPIQPQVELRNQGQNGANAPEQSMQMHCSESIMGDRDLEFLYLWYPMIPIASYAAREEFIRNWFSHSKSLVHVTLPDDLFPFENFKEAGFITKILWQHGQRKIDWIAPAGLIWGARGDGFCRFDTREGAAGIVMQNWHNGPMGFQFMADGLAVFYGLAMERAVEWALQGDKFKLPELPKIPSGVSKLVQLECENKCRTWRQCFNIEKHATTQWGKSTCAAKPYAVACVSGSEPQWGGMDAHISNTWKATSVKDAAFPNATGWEYFKIKQVSSINSAGEKSERGYASRPECSDFHDQAFSYRARVGVVTEWLEMTWPKRAIERLRGYKMMEAYVCHGQRYPFKAYTQTMEESWMIESRVNDKMVGGPVTPAANFTVPSTCIKAWSGDPIPIPTSVGTKFAIRFRNTNETQPSKEPIVVGNILFFGVD